MIEKNPLYMNFPVLQLKIIQILCYFVSYCLKKSFLMTEFHLRSELCRKTMIQNHLSQ
jgi:hypothetical protein